MRIGAIRQTKMPAVFRRVNRLLHGAQQHGVNLLRIRPVFGGIGDGLKLARRRVIADRQAHAHGLEVAPQNFFLFRRGAFMHAEQARMFALGDVVGTAHIGGQHRLFNHPVGHVAGTRYDLFNTPVFIAYDLCLGGFKVHRTPFEPGFGERLINTMQIQQIFHPLLALQGFWAARIAQNGSDFGVGKARVAPHQCGVELVGVHLAILGDEHVTHHAQALHLGIEGTQSVGQFFRQHGNHTAGKVHAGGAVISVNVNRRAGFHIVAHIGNRHQQTPPLNR